MPKNHLYVWSSSILAMLKVFITVHYVFAWIVEIFDAQLGYLGASKEV